MACLVVILSITPNVSTSAMETVNYKITEEEPGGKFSHIHHLYPSIKVSSDGTVDAGTIVRLRTGTDADNCMAVIKIQEYNNGRWTTKVTKSTKGKSSAIAKYIYKGFSDRKYRVIAYGYAYKGDKELEEFHMIKY